MAREKDKKVLVTVGGWFLGFAEKLQEELLQRGVSSEDIYAFVQKRGDPRVATIAEELAKVMAKKPEGDIYEAEVNYNLRLQAAIKSGNYDWVNSDITEKHFPATRSGLVKLNFVIYHPNRNISSDEVKKEMEKQDLRSAELPELLAFGAKYPDIQRKFPVVALGSVWRHWYGDQVVPYLDGFGDERRLGLYWLGRGWGSSCRFLAVRES